jgi:hypothetical protein
LLESMATRQQAKALVCFLQLRGPQRRQPTAQALAVPTSGDDARQRSDERMGFIDRYDIVKLGSEEYG